MKIGGQRPHSFKVGGADLPTPTPLRFLRPCTGEDGHIPDTFFRHHLLGNYSGSENYNYCRCWAHVWSS